jgi:hypothetical protein
VVSSAFFIMLIVISSFPLYISKASGVSPMPF